MALTQTTPTLIQTTPTIVPPSKIQTDPQTILYLYPSISPVKYTKMSRDYHHYKAVSLVEATARMSGKLLVPGTAVHWERRKALKDRRVLIYGKPYYVLADDELTRIERLKYNEALYDAMEEVASLSGHTPP